MERIECSRSLKNAQGRPQVRYHNYYHDHLTSIKDKVNLYSVILTQTFGRFFEDTVDTNS